LIGAGFRAVGDGTSVWIFDVTKLEQAPYHPLIILRRAPAPRLGFTASEKDTLFCAVLGQNDTEIASELHVSVETIRKRWRSIFQRVSAQTEAEILPPAPDDLGEAKRGPEKRRALLQYLGAHLAELRPHAQ
jgi:DNA-binding CsgD family transcriptional regulator